MALYGVPTCPSGSEVVDTDSEGVGEPFEEPPPPPQPSRLANAPVASTPSHGAPVRRAGDPATVLGASAACGIYTDPRCRVDSTGAAVRSAV